MKIICTQENLRQGLAIASKIIPSVNTLPILSNLLLKTSNGQLRISSTNLELAINTHVRCKIQEEGQTTITAKTFNDLVNNLPDENLFLSSNDKELTIKTENQEFKIKTLPAEEFPFIPQNPEEKSISIEGEKLKEALNKVVFSTSNNQTQPEISGVYFAMNNGQGRLVATDRYRLSEKSFSAQGEAEVILPQKAALEISRILSYSKELAEIAIKENQFFISTGQTELISRLVDGQYPDYKNIIPENFNSIITVDRNKLTNALKTNSLFSQNSSSVRIVFSIIMTTKASKSTATPTTTTTMTRTII
ncbi:MAG: DNA polymerase III subunit beta [Candidatus Doudnabacteria bacterium]|nr:DNA polymerase III subunit beta [Candidatus Doudnabacteria bacterium]